jgi:hypothetical integral membrane protein (TIGR02206 family)
VTARPFIFFGPAHLGVLAVTVLTAVGLVWLVRHHPRAAPGVRFGLAALLLVLMVWTLISERLAGTPWSDLAPLHLCDLAIFVGLFALVTRAPLACEVLYFWACAGTLLAIITPDVSVGFPHPRFLSYFALHGGVVVSAVLVVWGLGRPPRSGAVWRVLLLTNAYAALMGVVNLVFGTNFLFLCAKPANPTLLDWFGPWPVYILVAEAVALALFTLLALPFRLGVRRS